MRLPLRHSSGSKWISEEGTLTTLVTLTAGQSFGELALVEENGKRAATIVTTSEVECLTISGDDYRNHLSRIHQEELHEKARYHLLRNPMLPRWMSCNISLLSLDGVGKTSSTSRRSCSQGKCLIIQSS